MGSAVAPFCHRRRGIFVLCPIWRLVLVLSAMGSACGTRAATKPTAHEFQGVGAVANENDLETVEQERIRRQTDAVASVCHRLVECSLEDARHKLSPKQIAEQKLESPALLIHAENNCKAQYISPMSLYQVQGLRDCLERPRVCVEFGDCVFNALTSTATAGP